MRVRRVLPVLRRVELRSFTLYRHQRSLSVEMGDGVFCLAGANGLGKSSFLAAINFGYTGIVAEAGKPFRSVREYYKFSQDYASKYFDGRIDEADRADATVGLEFRVGESIYTLLRAFFEPTVLREFTVRDGSGKVLLDTSGLTGEERQSAYAQRLTAECKLSAFDQFAFLQHFLVTFDERRHLLFWDSELTDPALYLAFGLEAGDAESADVLKRDIERADSLGRNAQWQATAARKRLAELTGPNDSDLVDLKTTYDSLLIRNKDAADAFIAARRDAEDAELRVAESSARLAQLRQSYDSAFARRIQSHHDARRHPVVVDLLHSHQCGVCGAAGAGVGQQVERALQANTCPLCGTDLKQGLPEDGLAELERLDDDLAVAQSALKDAQTRAGRLDVDSKALGQVVQLTEDELAAFEAANVKVMPAISGPAAASSAMQRVALQSEHEEAVARRDRHRADRDRFRSQLEPLQRKLGEAYEEAELEFVPLFRSLAKSFIGLDLDIFLVPNKAAGFSLVLEMQGSRRRTTSQLSESQRFFLDIALRMALVEHMTGAGGSALLIDTPEGSLDISYEKRAGVMFATFVAKGNQIVMTANINASQLLVQLAEQCGSRRMQLVRMTDWAALSEVQAEAEDLFDAAYRVIEKGLADSHVNSAST